MRTLSIASGRARLAVSAAGEGAPLVFLHAGVCDKRMWQAQQQAFSATHTTIAFDRRGFGETTYEAEPFDALADLDAVLAATTRQPALLVGCSQGGRIAVDFALAHPARVQALILVAPAIGGAPEVASYPTPIEALHAAMVEAENAHDMAALNALEAHAWLDGPCTQEGRVAGSARELFLAMNERALNAPSPGEEHTRTDAYARFVDLQLPILFITGALDFPLINARSAHLASVAPNAELIEMPGVAHLPSLEQPAAFNAIVTRFLNLPR